MSSHGSVVLDELIMPITGVSLTGEAFVITAEVRGPVQGRSSASYVVNGRDGRTVYASRSGDTVTIPTLHSPHSTAILTICCEVTDKVATRVGQTVYS